MSATSNAPSLPKDWGKGNPLERAEAFDKAAISLARAVLSNSVRLGEIAKTISDMDRFQSMADKANEVFRLSGEKR